MVLQTLFRVFFFVVKPCLAEHFYILKKSVGEHWEREMDLKERGLKGLREAWLEEEGNQASCHQFFMLASVWILGQGSSTRLITIVFIEYIICGWIAQTWRGTVYSYGILLKYLNWVYLPYYCLYRSAIVPVVKTYGGSRRLGCEDKHAPWTHSNSQRVVMGSEKHSLVISLWC